MAGRVAADSSCALHFMVSTLTGPRLRLRPQRTFPDHTSAHARRPPPTPRLAFGLFRSSVAERPFSAFPPSAATVVRGGGREGAGEKVGGG